MNLYLFLPAYNVQIEIPGVLEGIDDLRLLCQRRAVNLHVLVMNDNSSDATGEVLDRWHGERPGWTTVVHNPQNKGNAHNIVAGYEWAVELGTSERDLVACIDSDGEHNPLDLVRWLDKIRAGRVDSVVGTVMYPPHWCTHDDMAMMHFLGGQQAAACGQMENPWYIQAPGFQMHNVRRVRLALEWFAEYRAFFLRFHSGREYPRWGMHFVMARLISAFAETPVSAYLGCVEPAPNRTPEKRRLQAQAAMDHINALEAFIAEMADR